MPRDEALSWGRIPHEGNFPFPCSGDEGLSVDDRRGLSRTNIRIGVFISEW